LRREEEEAEQREKALLLMEMEDGAISRLLSMQAHLEVVCGSATELAGSPGGGRRRRWPSVELQLARTAALAEERRSGAGGEEEEKRCWRRRGEEEEAALAEERKRSGAGPKWPPEAAALAWERGGRERGRKNG
jgi:hypothetical protein